MVLFNESCIFIILSSCLGLLDLGHASQENDSCLPLVNSNAPKVDAAAGTDRSNDVPNPRNKPDLFPPRAVDGSIPVIISINTVWRTKSRRNTLTLHSVVQSPRALVRYTPLLHVEVPDVVGHGS